MESPFYKPVFKVLSFLLLAFFSFFQNGNAATELRTVAPHFEKIATSKQFLKLKNKVKKKAKKRRKKRHKTKSNYDDFDYNILLLITFGIILIAVIIGLLGSVFSILLLGISVLLLMICISNGAHKSAWWALGATFFIFWFIYFANREED